MDAPSSQGSPSGSSHEICREVLRRSSSRRSSLTAASVWRAIRCEREQRAGRSLSALALRNGITKQISQRAVWHGMRDGIVGRVESGRSFLECVDGTLSAERAAHADVSASISEEGPQAAGGGSCPPNLADDDVQEVHFHLARFACMHAR